MSDKPSVISQLLDLLGPEARAAIMAVVIAILRIMYDQQEARWQRVCLESLLCGAISYGLASGLRFFNLEAGLAVFAGGLVGFLGVEFVRERARKWVVGQTKTRGEQ